ncbi:hypothetical protein C9427_30415 [Mesorhizobium helmanticense]|uniref:Uncharacterized protein n=1 Tax=Mesorhizobium helmanticense TaxID=1776423 RepID=A0A2T4ILX0_9HYPH|nr:hypothetical protein C9427_30415 [Mesorhizobium helmanticense]
MMMEFMMLTSTKMFLMMTQEGDYGALVRGADAASAIERHYAEMDAWCPPLDPELKRNLLSPFMRSQDTQKGRSLPLSTSCRPVTIRPQPPT